MIITPSNRNLFFATLNTDFNSAYSKVVNESWARKFFQVMPMASEQLAIGWAGSLKRARRWDGPRVVDEPAPRTYVVNWSLYEKTVGIDSFVNADDQYGIYQRAIQDAAMYLGKEEDYQGRDLLFNQGLQTGSFQTGVDGVNNWSASHPVNYYDTSFGTYCNDYRGGVTINSTVTGGALAPVSYMTARQDFMTRKSESGETLGVMPNMLMHGPLIETTAKTLLEAEFFSPATFYGLTNNVGNVQNMLRNTTALFMNADFPVSAAGLDWFLLCTNRGVMPFTQGMRESPQIVAKTAPTDDNVFHSHQDLFGGHARWVMAWGLPWLSAISGPTAGV